MPLIVLGGGGHAKVLIDALLISGNSVLGYCCPETRTETILGISRFGLDEDVFQLQPHAVHLVNGIGSVGSTGLRQALYERFKSRGFTFDAVLHPAAILAPEVRLGEGAQIMAGAILQTGTRIGANSIVNTGASVDHDCAIGNHVHISPGAVLCGNVCIADRAHVGAGSTIIQGISVGSGALIAAGAVVVSDVPANVKAIGVPARYAASNASMV